MRAIGNYYIWREAQVFNIYINSFFFPGVPLQEKEHNQLHK
jgi:hypothetical protein